MSDVLRAEWLIKKRGYFYRADKAGYTARLEDAGLYTEAVAKAEASIEPSVMSAHHISEFPTLRAALAPVTDEEVAGIRERHEATENDPDPWDWESRHCHATHTDRETLLRRDAQREAELGRLREALGAYNACADDCIHKAMFSSKQDVVNHIAAAERRARAALNQEHTNKFPGAI